MGMTISDRNQRMYNDWLSQGYSHDEIIEMIPKRKRAQFIADIEKTPFESHFGMTFTSFVIIMTIVTGLVLIIFG